MMQRKTSKRKLKKHSKKNGLRKEPKEQAGNFARAAFACWRISRQNKEWLPVFLPKVP
jgi:hypothetical protein